MFRRAISRLLYPFKSRRLNQRIPGQFYNKFVTFEAFNRENDRLNTQVRELKGLINQLAAKDKLKPLNGVLMTEKEVEAAEKAMERRFY